MSVYEIITDDNTSPEAKIRILFSALETERDRRIRAEEDKQETLKEKEELKQALSQKRPKPNTTAAQAKKIIQLERQLKTADALIKTLENELAQYESRLQEKDERILDLINRNKELRNIAEKHTSLQ